MSPATLVQEIEGFPEQLNNKHGISLRGNEIKNAGGVIGQRDDLS